jgi:hypothetical protein
MNVGDTLTVVPPSCFVIGPIGNRFAPIGSEDRSRYEAALEVWANVILEATKAVGMTALRADTISIPGEITDQIFRQIRDADVVIADVSEANPNVMYELGLRHATGKLTVQLGEYGRLPFDVAAIRTIQFVRTPGGLVDARKRLEAALTAGLASDVEWSSAQRVFADLPPILPAKDQDVAQETEPGFLELLADMEQAMPVFLAILNDFSEELTALGDLAQEGTKAISDTTARGGSLSDRLAIVGRFADSLDPHAARLENLADAYEMELRRLDAGIDFLLNRGDEDEEERANLVEFFGTLVTLSDGARVAMSQSLDLAVNVERLGSAARPLRSPTHRVGSALRRVATASQVMDHWKSRAETVLRGIGAPKPIGAASGGEKTRVARSSRGQRKRQGR